MHTLQSGSEPKVCSATVSAHQLSLGLADFSATWNSVDPSRETPIVSRSVTLVVDDGRTDSGAAAGTPKADAATPARSGNSTSRHSPASPSRGRKGGTHFSLDDVMSGESDSVCTTPSAASWPKRGPQSLADTEVLSPAESQRTPRDVPAGRSERTSYVRTFMNRCGRKPRRLFMWSECPLAARLLHIQRSTDASASAHTKLCTPPSSMHTLYDTPDGGDKTAAREWL